MRQARAGHGLVVAAISGLAACAPAFHPAVEPEGGACRAGDVSFRVPAGESHQAVLARWCAAVGPAVYMPQRSVAADVARITSEVAYTARPALPVADSVLVVAWNNHVGGGALERFVDDLRAGRLTGGAPVRHFVLLLQEVYRSSETVPALRAGMLHAGGIDEVPPTGVRTDIADWARSHPELAVLYVPSMRNGAQAGAESRQDRGSAIVTSLPLTDPFAYELPVVRQRRVVPAGVVTAQRSDGTQWSMHVASVHLENQPEGARNPERARFEQFEWLLDAVPDSATAVLGGDMNTWMRGPDEVVVWRARRSYPDTPPIPVGPTYIQAGGVLRMYLDYLFFRLDDGRVSDYRRVPDSYGSDHYPLLAWVHATQVGRSRSGGEGAADDFVQIGGSERLLQESVAASSRVDAHLPGRVARHEQHPQAGSLRAQHVRELGTTRSAHEHVREQQVERALAEHGDRLVGA